MCVLDPPSTPPAQGTNDGNWARGIVDALVASEYANWKIAVRRNGVSCCRLRNPQSSRFHRLSIEGRRTAARMHARLTRQADAKAFPPSLRPSAPAQDPP